MSDSNTSPLRIGKYEYNLLEQVIKWIKLRYTLPLSPKVLQLSGFVIVYVTRIKDKSINFYKRASENLFYIEVKPLKIVL